MPIITVYQSPLVVGDSSVPTLPPTPHGSLHWKTSTEHLSIWRDTYQALWTADRNILNTRGGWQFSRHDRSSRSNDAVIFHCWSLDQAISEQQGLVHGNVIGGSLGMHHASRIPVYGALCSAGSMFKGLALHFNIQASGQISKCTQL